MGIAKGKRKDNDIQKDYEGEYIFILSNKNDGFFHEDVTEDIQEGVFVEHFEYFEAPVSKDLIDKVVGVEVQFHGNFIYGEFVGLSHLGNHFEFLVQELIELQFKFLNEVKNVNLLEVRTVAVFVHALEFNNVEHFD